MPTPTIGHCNRVIGWGSLSTGVLTGLILGLWSFDGPLSTPAWLGEYGDTARRLARLGHIAFFGLGILNLFLARELLRLPLSARARRIAAVTMNFGNIGLPLTLFLAAAYPPAKYVLSIPASSVLVALVITFLGVVRSGGDANR